MSSVHRVKRNSPQVGGFSLPISPSRYRSLASFVRRVFFFQPRTLRIWTGCGLEKARRDSGLLGLCAGASGRSACCLCNSIFRPPFPPRHYFSDDLRGGKKKTQKLCKKLEKRLWDVESHTWPCKLDGRVGEVGRREVKLEMMVLL